MNLAKKQGLSEEVENLKNSQMWAFWQQEFNGETEWLCPDVSQIEF